MNEHFGTLEKLIRYLNDYHMKESDHECCYHCAHYEHKAKCRVGKMHQIYNIYDATRCDEYAFDHDRFTYLDL